MPGIFSRKWDTDVYKGKTSFNTGLFINGQFVDGRKGTTIEWAVLLVLRYIYTNLRLIVVVLSIRVRRHFSVWLYINILISFIQANGEVITKISEATEEDVDIAVEAAQKAFETTWGLNAPGSVRSDLLWKLAGLMERDFDELAALEALDNGTLTLPFLQIYQNW